MIKIPRLSFFNKSWLKADRGFTLLEIIVVIAIITILTINLLNNFLRSDLGIEETTRMILADIRRAQSDALTSKQFGGLFRCGYGLHMLTSTQGSTAEPFGQTYYIYTLQNGPGSCGNFNYQTSDVKVVAQVLDPRLEICAPPTGSDNCGQSGGFPRFVDIFFETPLGITRIDNRVCPIANADNAYSQILIRKKGATCPSDNCSYICVYASGKITSGPSSCTPEAC